MAAGDPGYSEALDQNGNGLACEPDEGFDAAADAADTAPIGLLGTVGDEGNPAPAPEPVPAAAPTPEPTPEPVPAAPAPAVDGDVGGADVYYANCSAVRAAGAAPIPAGAPGYRPALDRDNDGWACE